MSITKYEIDHNIYCTVHDKSTNTVGFCYSVHDSQFCKREKNIHIHVHELGEI